MKRTKLFRKRLEYNELLDMWLESQKNQLKESTYATYSNHVQKHIKPYFNKMYLSKMNHEMIQCFINEKIKNGRLDHKGGLSVKTVKELVNVIKLSLKYAIQRKYITEFNFDFKIPHQKHHIKLINNDEYIKLTNYLKKDQSKTSIGLLLILCTGIRIGELCALQNKNIDLKRHELHINKTLQRIQDLENGNTKIIITSTKTSNSDRIIPIPKSLIPYINKTNDNYYFLTQTSKYIEPRILRYRFKRIIKKLQITEVTVHSLRHYFASQCIELGFDYNCLSEILGHSSPSTTMNLYVHSKDKYKEMCMNKICI